jgi:hypothetical protein
MPGAFLTGLLSWFIHSILISFYQVSEAGKLQPILCKERVGSLHSIIRPKEDLV